MPTADEESLAVAGTGLEPAPLDGVEDDENDAPPRTPKRVLDTPVSASASVRLTPTDPLSAANTAHIGFARFVWRALSMAKKKLDRKRSKVRVLSTTDVVIALLVAVGYACLIFCRLVFAAVAPALQNADSQLTYTLAMHGNLLIGVGATYAFGKLVNGHIIDRNDPRVCMIFYWVISAASVFMVSLVHDVLPAGASNDSKYAWIFFWACANSFVQSGGWPSCTKFIYLHFRPAQYGRVFSILSLGSRFGSIFTSLTLGAALFVFPWPDVVRIAAGVTFVGILPLIGTRCFETSDNAALDGDDYVTAKHGAGALAPPHRDSLRLQDGEPVTESCMGSFRRYASWWSHRQFQLMGIFVAMTTILMGFEGFASLMLANSFAISPGAAATITATIPAGIVTSLTLGGWLFEKVSRPTRANLTLLFLFGVIVAFSALAGLTAADCLGPQCAGAAGFLLFVYGCLLGHPYYIDPTVFALHFGGESSAAVTSQLDMLGSASGAAFASLASILAAISWTWVIVALVGAALIAFVSMALFHWFELLEKKELKATERLLTSAALSSSSGGAGGGSSNGSESGTGKGSANRLLNLQQMLEEEYDNHELPNETIKHRAVRRVLEHFAQASSSVKSMSFVMRQANAFQGYALRANLVQYRGALSWAALAAGVVITIVCFVLYLVARLDQNFEYPFWQVTSLVNGTGGIPQV